MMHKRISCLQIFLIRCTEHSLTENEHTPAEISHFSVINILLCQYLPDTDHPLVSRKSNNLTVLSVLREDRFFRVYKG